MSAALMLFVKAKSADAAAAKCTQFGASTMMPED
jgi:hypothetical protein